MLPALPEISGSAACLLCRLKTKNGIRQQANGPDARAALSAKYKNDLKTHCHQLMRQLVQDDMEMSEEQDPDVFFARIQELVQGVDVLSIYAGRSLTKGSRTW